MISMIKTKIRLLFFLLLSIISCNKNDKHLHRSFILAGTNKNELEKVLEHYKNDKLKLKAAEFLIINMPGSFSSNEDIINICIPFYNEYDSLAKIHDYTMNTERGKMIDSLWNHFENKHLRLLQSYQSDLKSVTSKQLISEIDLAFKTWKENVYMKDCSFDEFCEYILPYRRINGLIIDDARESFYRKHHGKYFTCLSKDMFEEVDSLLYEYRHLTHSQFWGTKIPILTASTLEYLRYGLCEHRCWYNSLLLSSLGMAVTIDFVPAWGNRNNNHSWNVLIKDGKSYAFEAFWDNDRWKYKRIYNNQTLDHLWGEFRLPKVYRHTFKNNIEGPIADKRVNPDNIPSLFKNIKIKDVSSEYFETSDVTLSLKSTPSKTYYAYLCVFGYQQWHPVQWGKIKNNKVSFKGMGKDIIYLPAYYENGKLIPAGEPFLLNSEGAVTCLKGNKRQTPISININYVEGAPAYNWDLKNIQLLAGLKIYGYSSKTHRTDSILTLPDIIPLRSVLYPIYSNILYDRITATFRSDTIAVSEITFYDNQNRIVIPDSIESNITPFNQEDSLLFVSDRIIASGIKGISKDKYIRFYFNHPTDISSIRIAPYIQSRVKNNGYFKLYYWDNGWKEIGNQDTKYNFLTFKHVPDNHLYMLRNQRWAKQKINTAERIFLYKDGEIIWY